MAKSNLYIFNPEHDLALASGESNYMAPASARQMANDLALLPAWYAEKGASVLASSAYNVDFLKAMVEVFDHQVNLVTPPELAYESDFEVVPWGWNPALRKRLLVGGMDESKFPSLEYLEQLRFYSHRSQAVKLLPDLQLNEYFCGESYYLEKPEAWLTFVEARESCLLKAPLSGSGKGLNWCKGKFTSSISGWCERISTLQGGVIGEPIYNKVQDFAMEFVSDGKGKVSFAGYSLFYTGKSGMYDGNRLLSDKRVAELLSKYVPLECLTALKVRLEKELSAIIGVFYKGYLGVDMMVCYFPGEKVDFRIHPCVEINLRMNMGVVVHKLTEHYLSLNTEGEFGITYYPSDGIAWQESQQKTQENPLLVENGRIVSGYMSLVPVTKQSRYLAWIRCSYK